VFDTHNWQTLKLDVGEKNDIAELEKSHTHQAASGPVGTRRLAELDTTKRFFAEA